MPVERKTDEALMVEYQNGDEQSFTELYHRHAPRIYGYLRKRVSDPAKADEIFQGTFMKLHENRNRYEPQYPFSPWLFTICRSVLIDAARRGSVFSEKSFEAFREDQLASNENATSGSASLDSVMRGMPAERQEVIEMRYIDGLSFEAIAKKLDVSETTARQRGSRAVRWLKNALEGKG